MNELTQEEKQLYLFNDLYSELKQRIGKPNLWRMKTDELCDYAESVVNGRINAVINDFKIKLIENKLRTQKGLNDEN